MAKRQPKIDPRQTSLFETLSAPLQEGPASFQIQNQLKNELSAGLKRCRMSRYEVAAKMSEMLGYEITKTMLDAYTAESKESYRFPAEWLAPFCAVTGHYKPLEMINRLARYPIPDAEKLLDLEIKRRREELEGIQNELNDLDRLRGIVGGKQQGG